MEPVPPCTGVTRLPPLLGSPRRVEPARRLIAVGDARCGTGPARPERRAPRAKTRAGHVGCRLRVIGQPGARRRAECQFERSFFGPRDQPSDNAAARREWRSPRCCRGRAEDRRASSGGSPRAIPWPSARRAAVVGRPRPWTRWPPVVHSPPPLRGVGSAGRGGNAAPDFRTERDTGQLSDTASHECVLPTLEVTISLHGADPIADPTQIGVRCRSRKRQVK